MSDTNEYTPDKVWTWKSENGGEFASINRPSAGSRNEAPLPLGKHPIQLYSLATPNGVKITLMLEELLALGILGAEYDAHLINITKGDQFGSGFVELNPNSKIPAMVDRSVTPIQPIFESGAILLYLAEKFGKFLPADLGGKTQCMSWLFWQVGSAPYLGGGFGHFYQYAPTKIEYCIDRFAMETKRQLDVMDRHLADNRYFCGEHYTIADMAIWPWYGDLALGRLYSAAEFLDVHSYKHVLRWAKEIDSRPAASRARMVNKTWGNPKFQLHERHDASDFESNTEDKRSRA